MGDGDPEKPGAHIHSLSKVTNVQAQAFVAIEAIECLFLSSIYPLVFLSDYLYSALDFSDPESSDQFSDVLRAFDRQPMSKLEKKSFFSQAFPELEKRDAEAHFAMRGFPLFQTVREESDCSGDKPDTG